MTYKLGPCTLKSDSLFTKKFIKNYVEGIRLFSRKKNKGLAMMSRLFSRKKNEGLAVMSATHQNYYYGSFPLSVFEGITPARNADLIEACKRIEDINGMVPLSLPEIRTAIKDKEKSRYELSYIFLRGLRDPGVVKKKYIAIDDPYNKEKDSPFINAEPKEHFQNGILNGVEYELFYHLYPYAPFHFMVIPERMERHNQYVDNKWLKFAWDFLNSANDPNLRIAYNSLGAYASQNHLHFQGFYVTEELAPPIEQTIDSTDIDQIGKGSLKWPIPHCLVFKGNDESVVTNAYQYIERIVKKAKANPYTIAFNFYIKPGSITVIPRKHQSTCVEHLNGEGKFSTGPAWIEMLGTWIIPKENYFDTDEQKILDFYRILSLKESELTP